MKQQKIFGITVGKDAAPAESKKRSSTSTQPLWKPSLPQVNNIPVKILEEYDNKILIGKFTKASIAIIAAGCLLFGFNTYADMQHVDALNAVEADAANVQAQVTALQPYQGFKANVSAKMGTLGETLATDVNVSKLFAELNTAAAKAGVNLSGMSITVAASDGSDASSGGSGACPSTDPFTSSPTIGCITFDGTQPNDTALEEFFSTIEGTEGISDVFISNATYSEDSEGESSNTFKGSAAFTSLFYSGRYDYFTMSLDDMIAAGGVEEARAAYEEALSNGEVDPTTPETTDNVGDNN